MRKINIAILSGGVSSERDISLVSAKSVVKYLDPSKFQIFQYDPATDLEKLIKNKDKVDVAFPVLHGKGGEDGTIQGLLELLRIPYVGSGVLASALAINKKLSKLIYQNAGLLTAKDLLLMKKDWLKNQKKLVGIINKKLSLPYVIKPNTQGSSVGIIIVKEKKTLREALEIAFKLDSEVLVEEYIKGKEFTGSVLGNVNPQALPVIEIIPPQGRFFDREVKYNGQTQEIVPAKISSKLAKEIQDIAILAHQVLGCAGFSRSDFIARNSQVYILETNTIPGLTSESLFPKAAAAAKIPFARLLEKLIDLALKKTNN